MDTGMGATSGVVPYFMRAISLSRSAMMPSSHRVDVDVQLTRRLERDGQTAPRVSSSGEHVIDGDRMVRDR